jgi:hypothetical protein
LCTAEGTPLPKNTRAELHRDIARLRVIRKQIGEIEQERSERLKRASEDRTLTMVRLPVPRHWHRGRDRRDAGKRDSGAQIARSTSGRPLRWSHRRA